MIIEFSNDGKELNKKWLKQEGFKINEERDFRKRFIKNEYTGEKTEKYEYVLDFVGFIVNNNHDLLTVFPKKFTVVNPNTDSAKLFKVISKHIQKKPEMYLGDKYGENFESNYPFLSFFGIYNYYVKYGLYFEDKTYIKANIVGKVNWKETIRLSNKYLINGKISFFPIYSEKKYYFTVFLTECIIYAIDYTIDKFGVFLDLPKTDRPFPNIDFFNEREWVLENLFALRQQTFKDSLLELIDNLINFFNELNEGGNFYFKHYSFSKIWEDMVKKYLESNYSEIKHDKIIFDPKKAKNIKFEKPSFHPNLANKDHYFTPDYYYTENDTQLIFDAKYYDRSKGMDYKQIAYFLFLKEQRENITDSPKYSKTFSSLILPSDKRRSELHFKMEPLYNKSNQDLVISEEYIDIREVMDLYV